MKALIDGDIILYACGFAAQHKYYRVRPVAWRDSDNYLEEFRYKKEAKAWIEGLEDGLEIYTRDDIEPLSHAVQNIDVLIKRIMKETGSDSYNIYLTGSDNFRDELVDYYKKNRDPTHKPYWYKELKEYLIECYDAIVVDGQEADDAMGIAQMKGMNSFDILSHGTEYPTIICTTDKDLNMIPGWHYNWQKDKKYWVTEEGATRSFYFQLLTGDSTDNIKGVAGIGFKGAERILSRMETEKEMFIAVEKSYQDLYGTWEGTKFMEENVALLWIRREEDMGWEQPK
jgi:5'-3' exonuclease